MQGHLVQVGHQVLEVLQAQAAQAEVQVLQDLAEEHQLSLPQLITCFIQYS
jgi:hypothetical protein